MTATEICSQTRITAVWHALGGGELRNGRGRAWWRGGDGWSVAVDDLHGRWYDHRDGIGGGLLDLVAHSRRVTRQDALRWLASLMGAVLDEKPASRVAARERAELARIRRDSLYFADAAALMAELALEQLPDNDPGRLAQTTLLAALRVSPESEYRAWLSHGPRMATALVRAGRERARRLQAALARWIAVGMPGVIHAG